MADIKCSKCGNVAQPGGFLGKDYKKWDGEIVCDSCYTQLTKATIEERETKEQAEQSAVKAVMNSSDEKNTVATILQVYAIVNAVLGVILSFVIAATADYMPIAGLVFSIVPIGASFLIYSFGEVIKLLHEIKLNTRKAVNGK